jgi:hypothetical protein
VGDEDYDSDEATQIRHFNSQTTSILLASLCREEYNKLHVVEPPELFQLKCPSRPLKGSNTLKQE